MITVRMPDMGDTSLDVLVSSNHPQATRVMAECVAEVFSQYSMEGVSDNAPVTMVIELQDDTKVPFRMQRVGRLNG